MEVRNVRSFSLSFYTCHHDCHQEISAGKQAVVLVAQVKREGKGAKVK